MSVPALHTSLAELNGDVDRAKMLLGRFQDAVNAMPEILERVAAGQQFNAYESAHNGEDDYDEERLFFIGIGPVTNFHRLCAVRGRIDADLLEAALKIAALASVRPEAGA